MKTRTLAIVLAAVVGVALIVLLVFDPFSAKASPFALKPDDARVVAQGGTIYRAQCAACHGAALEGQPDWRQRNAEGMMPAPPHDASGHTWHHPDQVLFDITKFGVAKVADLKDYKTTMPVYQGVLRDEEIVAVLSWIKAQWPEQIRGKHDQMNAAHRQQLQGR